MPKKLERVFTDGLSQTEVKSRLQALANTIDSRGWAVKNVNLNTYAAPLPTAASSDRLIDISNLPQVVPDNDVVAADDILDERNNPIAQQFDTMINQSSQAHRQQLVDQLNEVRHDPAAQSAAAQADYWFMRPEAEQGAAGPPVPAPQAAADDAALTAQLKASSNAHQSPYGHLRTVQPISDQPAPQAVQAAAAPAMTPPSDPAILALANNDDFNVATLAREAQKARGDDESQDEVVISLR